MKKDNISTVSTIYTIALCAILSYSVSLSAQAPITELSGFLELYHSEDTTSLYLGIDAGQKVITFLNRGQNTFVGSKSGKANTTGGGNTFVGHLSGLNNIDGSDNSFYGIAAGLSNTTGDFNSFFGSGAGNRNTTGRGNSFFGNFSGFHNTTGNFNSFFGDKVGLDNTTGKTNSFFGSSAGSSNTSGSSNSFFGSDSGSRNTTASSNSFFGVGSGSYNTTSSGNSFFGSGSGRFNNGERNSFFGNGSGLFNRTGNKNSFFGESSGKSNISGGDNNFFGFESGFSNMIGGDNSFYGTQSGYHNISGTRNNFFGRSSGALNTVGSDNSFFGNFSGVNNTTGDGNSFFGNIAGRFNSTGSENSFFGVGAGEEVTVQNRVIALGHRAGPSDSLSARSNRLYIDVVSSDDPLIYGEFDNDLVRINGELHLGATNYGVGGGGNDDGVIRSPRAEGADIFMVANDGILMLIGDEESEFGTFEVWNGTNNVRLLEVEEDGDTRISGNLSVSGTINGVSDINRKNNFEPISTNDILSKISEMPITEWQYKGSEEKHIGPMAQDFYAAFGLGQGETTIATVDADGIALAGIQALNQKLEKQNTLLSIKNQDLEKRIQRLEFLLLKRE